MTNEEQIQSAEALLACAKGDATEFEFFSATADEWHEMGHRGVRNLAARIASDYPVRIKAATRNPR